MEAIDSTFLSLSLSLSLSSFLFFFSVESSTGESAVAVDVFK